MNLLYVFERKIFILREAPLLYPKAAIVQSNFGSCWPMELIRVIVQTSRVHGVIALCEQSREGVVSEEVKNLKLFLSIYASKLNRDRNVLSQEEFEKNFRFLFF